MSLTLTPVPAVIDLATERAARVSKTARCLPLEASNLAKRSSLYAARGSPSTGPGQAGSPPSQSTVPKRRSLCSEVRPSGSPFGVKIAKMRTMCIQSSSRARMASCRATSRQNAGATLSSVMRRSSAKSPADSAARCAAAAIAAPPGSWLDIVLLQIIEQRSGGFFMPQCRPISAPRPNFSTPSVNGPAGHLRQRLHEHLVGLLLQLR